MPEPCSSAAAAGAGESWQGERGSAIRTLADEAQPFAAAGLCGPLT